MNILNSKSPTSKYKPTENLNFDCILAFSEFRFIITFLMEKRKDYINIYIFHGIQANTKHLYNICTTPAQRLQRWPNIVQMLYKCFVFAWMGLESTR